MSDSPRPVPLPYLEAFQNHCRSLWQQKMDEVADTLEELRTHRDAARMLLSRRKGKRAGSGQNEFRDGFMERTIAFLDAGVWLEENRAAYSQVLDVGPEAIDVRHPLVDPLWRNFAGERKPEWQRQSLELRDVLSACDWEDEALSSQPPETQPCEVEEVRCRGVFDPAFSRDESGAYELNPLKLLRLRRERDIEEDEDDEDELEEETHADDADLTLASAGPQDDEVEEGESEPPQAVPTPLLRPFRLPDTVPSNSGWHRLFDLVVARIFVESGIDEKFGAIWWVGSMPEDTHDDELCSDILHTARVQKEIWSVFRWAMAHDERDTEKLLQEVRDSLSVEPRSDANEFTHRSNGHSGFWHAHLDYEGTWDDGASLVDGFSIQSAQRVTRNYPCRAF